MDDCARGFWDRYWSEQGPTIAARTMTRVLDAIKLERLRAILPHDAHTLEVGAGSARLSCLLAREGHRTACLDLSLPALGAARANYADAGALGCFVAGDGFRLPFLDERFDAALSTGLLEHFQNALPLVREMVRVVRPGGILYSDIVPRKFSLFRSLDWVGRLGRSLVGRRPLGEGFFERAFTPAEIRNLLEEAGLVGARVFAAGVVPPYLPLLYRCRGLREAQVRLVEQTQGFWKRLDGTRVAEWLGFYYFAWGTKP